MKEIEAGDVIGKYQVLSKLGSGGMSVVWLAMDPVLNKTWAIKEVKKNASVQQYKVNVELTRREAFIMRDLNHPALPHINEIIEDRDTLFVVMEYVPGRNLADILKERGRAFDEDAVIDWGIQLCDALGYLHSLNPPVIYRDMKPGNVILQDDGSVRIIDFGIAKESREGADTIVAGTPEYAPREAMSDSDRTDQRTDVYSLGLTLFNLVTGERPKDFAVVPPIRDINPALSPSLEHTIAVAIQQDPDKRWQSCNEMRYELEHPEDPAIVRHMKRMWSMFKTFSIAAVVCLVLGIGCLVASSMVTTSSYDGLMSRAAMADTNEKNVVDDDKGYRHGDPSEAEELYEQAIEVMPRNIEPYWMLVSEAYTGDNEFSQSEAERWNRLYAAHERDIDRAETFAKLCYQVGSDYFLYSSYGDELARNTQAVVWFDRAIKTYEANGNRDGANGLTETEYRTAQAYRTIGDFSKAVVQATNEGKDNEAYEAYFRAFEDAVNDEQITHDPTIVQLRLYNMVVDAMKSQKYVEKFALIGISQGDMTSLLNKVEKQTKALSSAVNGVDKAEELYQSILEGIAPAKANIDARFNSVGARKGGASS